MTFGQKLNPTAVNLLKLSRERYNRNLVTAFAEHNEIMRKLDTNANNIAEILKDLSTVNKELEALGA